ncbi:MAG: hypothetical protein Q9192_001319 [Flavoplaca navasiana]
MRLSGVVRKQKGSSNNEKSNRRAAIPWIEGSSEANSHDQNGECGYAEDSPRPVECGRAFPDRDPCDGHG